MRSPRDVFRVSGMGSAWRVTRNGLSWGGQSFCRHAATTLRIDDSHLEGHALGMSTLVQIESAVVALPQRDQWSLLTWLQGRLVEAGKPQPLAASERQQWLAELAELRERNKTGTQGAPLQNLLDDIREDRL
jgi:hypothetical protein